MPTLGHLFVSYWLWRSQRALPQSRSLLLLLTVHQNQRYKIFEDITYLVSVY